MNFTLRKALPLALGIAFACTATAQPVPPVTIQETESTEQPAAVPAPRVLIQGPKTVAAGAPAKYTAFLKDQRIPGDPSTLLGEWTLPDGRKVSGHTLTWSPTEKDFNASHTASLHFRAWVVGHEADATTSTTVNVTINNRWPTFVLDTSTDGNIVPIKTRMKVGVAPADKILAGQFGLLNPLSITWTLPSSGITVKRAEKVNAEFTVTEAGSYPITVQITDSRGRKTTLESTLDALAPADFDISWDIKKSNEQSRRPVEFRLEPKIVGGHPRDRLNVFNYSVDGKPIAGSAAKVRLNFNEAGAHEVKLEAQSKMGFATSKTLTLTVAPNKLPQCSMAYDYTPVSRAGERSILVRMNCSDPDGKVKGYAWTLDGVLNKNAYANGYRYTYNAARCADIGNQGATNCPQNAVIEVSVTDDSGDAALFHYEVPRLYSQCSAQADGRCNAGDTVEQAPSNGTSNSGKK